jgi:hypothetical protein
MPRPLTTRQIEALDLLAELLETEGQPGPDHGEQAVPLDQWRTKVRTMFPDHANARQMVRRTTEALIATGCVRQASGLAWFGDFAVRFEPRTTG